MTPDDAPPARRVPDDPSRRALLRAGALAGIAAVAARLAACRTVAPRALPEAGAPFAAPPIDEVRIGFVGVGGMGSAHVENFLKIEGCRVAAVCDVVPEKVARVQARVVEAGFARPAGYDRGPRDFERLCAEEDLDLVFTATPWEWHVPVCVAAMRNQKHAATEVPAATTADGCWELVETSAAARRHCVMMENCCYGRRELMVLHMVRRGLLGELLYAECGYLHDLRALKFAREGEGLWRRAHAIARDANLYPTHGLGPVAQRMDLGRGDRMETLVSFSTASRGLELYAREHFEQGDPRRAERFRLGDVNASLIRTANGRVVLVTHNCDSPRPYSRVDLTQGTRGIVSGFPDRIHVEGRSPEHQWEDLEAYRAEFEHPLWRALEERAQGAGHGGMDYLEDFRLVECLRRGEPTDFDVYDAADWSVVTELSERSVAGRGTPVAFPDFTRGAWRTRPPLAIVGA